MHTHSKKLLAIGLAASMALAACGGDDTDPTSAGVPGEQQSETETEATETETGSEVQGEQAGVDDPSAQLRATLTSLLQEHVYLAGAAIEQALDAGGNMDDPAVQAAVATLDENTVALADAVGSVSSDEDREAFLGLWREHIGYFVDYTLGKATGDQAMVDTALTELDGYQQAAGDFFAEITGGELPAETTVQNLEMHIETLTQAIDALVAGEPTAFAQLREAAQHMRSTATALSGAISTALPDQFPNDVESAPAETLTTLTYLLQEHAYLAGIAIEQAVENGGDLNAPAVQAAVETLDANTVDLADVVGSVSSDEDREAFIGLWREHIGYFVDYTLGKATGDQAMVDTALTELDGYQQAAGDFFAEITGGELPAEATVGTLEEHITTLTQAIDAVVAGEPAAYQQLREAAQHMPMAAEAIAGAVVAATS